MTLAALLNSPKTADDWAVWSYAHRDQHLLIRNAIQSAYGINLNVYVLDPINLQDFNDFLNNNQIAHNDFTGVLGITNNDLSQVDFKDANQEESWIFLHFQEHYDAANKLRIS